MKRISQKFETLGIGGNDKRKRLGSNPKKKKKFRKTVIHRTKKPLYTGKSDPTTSPPYYDPHELHVCKWVYGEISAPEDPTKKFHSIKRKSFKGKYCMICHKPNYNSIRYEKSSSSIKVREDKEDFLKKVMKSIATNNINEDNKKNENNRVISIEKKWENLLYKFFYKNIFHMKHPSEQTDEYLILDSMTCKFIAINGNHEASNRNGIVVKQLPSKDVVVKEFGTNIEYIIKPINVFHLYGKYITHTNLFAIGKIPMATQPNKIHYWKSKWNNFKKWSECIQILKFTLPEQCQYYQTFYDDEIPEPIYEGPETDISFHRNREIQSREIRNNYRKWKSEQKSMAQKIRDVYGNEESKYEKLYFILQEEYPKYNYAQVVKKPTEGKMKTTPLVLGGKNLYDRLSQLSINDKK